MSTLAAVLSTEPLASFLVNIAASLTWDATKRGWRAIHAAVSTPQGGELEAEFAKLRLDSRFRRDLDAAIIQAIRTLPPDRWLGATQSIEMLGDAVHGLLDTPELKTNSVVDRIRAAVDETVGPQIGEREAIDLVTAVLVSIADNALIAHAVLIQGQHQILTEQHRLGTAQASGLERLSVQQDRMAASLHAKMESFLSKGRDVSSISGLALSASQSAGKFAGIKAVKERIGGVLSKVSEGLGRRMSATEIQELFDLVRRARSNGRELRDSDLSPSMDAFRKRVDEARKKIQLPGLDESDLKNVRTAAPAGS